MFTVAADFLLPVGHSRGLGDGRWPISTNGGVSPLWGPDSRELFYRELEPGLSGSNTIMMTVNDTSPSFNPGTPQRLFDGVYRTDFPFAFTWDITPDGERFLMMIKDATASDDAVAAEGKITIILNWFEKLTRLVPVPYRSAALLEDMTKEAQEHGTMDV